MDDELKEYLEENREVIDTENPSDRVWLNIRTTIDSSKGDSDASLWWKVAAVFFMALSVVLLLERNYERVDNYAVADPVIYNDDFREVKTFYTSIIEQKKSEFEEVAGSNSELVVSFERDLSELDSAYSDLEREYAISKNDRIVEAMIENLKTKIDVLSSYMRILEDLKEKETKYNDEKSA